MSIVAWGALVAFAVLSVGPPLLGDGTFLGTDLLQNVAPWQSALGPTRPAFNALVGDTVDTVVPQTWAIVDMLRFGQSPAWNPWVGGGVELGGLPNSGVYSPLSIAWWVLPLSAAPGATKLIEIVVVAVGMSLFLRRLHLPNPTWALAALIFVSSGFMVSWTNWQHTRVAAVIPLLFWALDRAAVRRRLIDAVPVGVVISVMFLGGFPAVTAYALYAGAAWVICRAISTGRAFRSFMAAAAVSVVGVVLGIGLCAWTLVPFIVNASSVLDFSTRAQSPDDSLDLLDLVSAVVPQFVGDVAVPTSYGAGSPIERLSYVGVVALMLVAVRFLRRRDEVVSPGARFQAVALVVCLVLIYVGGPALGLAQELPVFSNNPIGRLRVLVGFFSAVLAAAGFALLLEPLKPSREQVDVLTSPPARQLDHRWFGLRLLTIAAIVGLVIVLVLSALSGIPGSARSGLVDSMTTAGCYGIAGLLLILVARGIRPVLGRAVALSLLPVLVLLPALDLVDHWWGWSEESTVYPATATTDFLHDNLGEQRFANTDVVLLPGSNSIYELRSVGGHAYQTAEWQDLLRAVDPRAMVSPTYSTFGSPTAADNIASPVLDRLGVKYVVFDPNVPAPGAFQAAERSAESLLLAQGRPVRSGIHSGPVRSVGFGVDGSADLPGSGAELTVSIVDASTGDRIATTNTWYRAISGERNASVSAEDIPSGAAWFAEISLSRGSAHVFAAADQPDAAALSLTVPAADGARIVQTGEATIVERTQALDRVRWADEAIVESDPDRRIDLLQSGEVPARTVVLEREGDFEPASVHEVEAGTQGTLSIEPTSSDPASITAMVQADEPGWVVIDDSLRRPGWSATVDGKPTNLLPAEHAGAAVRVPAGHHEVRVQYTVAGLEAGVHISLWIVALLAGSGLAWCVLALRTRRRRAGT